MIEIILEEANGPAWNNNDIWHQVQECLDAAEELETECHGELNKVSSRFCSAADRVLNGAKEEVRTILGEVGTIQTENDKIVGKIEQVKSEIQQEMQRIDDLKLANSARRLCLLENGTEFSKLFSQSVRHDLETQVGQQKIFGQEKHRKEDEEKEQRRLLFEKVKNKSSNEAEEEFFQDQDDNNSNEQQQDSKRRKSSSVSIRNSSRSLPGSPKTSNNNNNNQRPSSSAAADQYLHSIKSRLRMLLSAASMQVKGQKTADEQMMTSNLNNTKYHTSYNQHSPVGGSRILQAIDAVLAYL